MFLYLHVTNGRDISQLSAVGAEGEVSILPGASFRVDSMERLPSGAPGRPKAREWWVVILSQAR